MIQFQEYMQLRHIDQLATLAARRIIENQGGNTQQLDQLKTQLLGQVDALAKTDPKGAAQWFYALIGEMNKKYKDEIHKAASQQQQQPQQQQPNQQQQQPQQQQPNQQQQQPQQQQNTNQG